MRISDDIGWQIIQLKNAKECLEYDQKELSWMGQRILGKVIQHLDEAIEEAETARSAIRKGEETRKGI